MTAYAFTGPSRLTPREEGLCRDTLGLLTDVTAIHTGGAHGWDVLVATEALWRWPDAEHRIYVPDAPYAAAAVEGLRELAATKGVALAVVAVRASGVAEKYRARNAAMLGLAARRGYAEATCLVPQAHVLVAGLRRPTFYRSGEWMTVNLARKAGITVISVDLGRAL